jgi:hypothetical protein
VKDCRDVAEALGTLEGSVERLRRRLGVFCMTANKESILMWSHYAANHSGFLLEFSTEGSEFFWRAMEVDYKPSRLCLNLVEKPAPNMYTESLRRKADVWGYEQEWRIIDAVNGPGIQRFPPEALTSAHLGCRITPENRNKIMNWCRPSDPRPSVYWAEEKSREFGLDFKRIERE